MRTLGYMLGSAQRATASGARIFQILDREPQLVGARTAAAAARRRRRPRRAARRVAAFATAPTPTRCATSTSTSTAGTTVALVGADRLGQDDARLAHPAPLRRHRGRGARRRRRRARRRPGARCAARSPSSPTTRSCSAPPCTRTSPTRGRDATRERGRARPPSARRRPASSTALPDGYDTRVGERGLTLSGRPAPADRDRPRAVADPRILVLDDATSSVDASTEQEIKQALREVMAGPHDVHHRPPPVDDRARRRDRRARGRPRRRPRHARRAARDLAALRARSSRRGCPTRSSSTASRSSARWRGCERRATGRTVARAARRPAPPARDERPRAQAARAARAAAPYRGAGHRSCFVALLLATAAALAPAPLAKLAIDDGHHAGRPRRARPRRRRVRRSARSSSGARRYVQTYLVGWVGQRALQDLRLQLFAHLQTLSVGFYSRRRAGVLISRMTNDVEALDQLVSDGRRDAVPVLADAGRHGRDPVRASTPSSRC